MYIVTVFKNEKVEGRISGSERVNVKLRVGYEGVQTKENGFTQQKHMI